MPCTPSHYRFCPCCGGLLFDEIRGDQPRLVCRDCRQVLYMNPAVGVAVVVRRGQEVLWGRRRSGPYAACWCIPCGYVEWGEEVRSAAVREFKEETGLTVELGPILSVQSNFHDPERLTVGLWFTGRVVGGILKPGDDLDQAGFFLVSSPPASLAFPTDEVVLRELKEGKIALIPDSAMSLQAV